jgi:predicted transposase/invertase (TIGR01784 family)
MQVEEKVQANQYDKVLKENMEASLGSIIQHTMGLHIIKSEEIPDDIQHTKEKKPDVLKIVTDQHNNTYILHMELQTKNERDMIYRMAEYCIMLQRKYRLPVKQYVLYTSNDKLTMITSISGEDFSFRYKIVSLQDVDYKIYLQKETPEERVLGILANFGEDSEDKALTNIVEAVMAVVDGELSAGKHIKQLNILAQLRNPKIKKENIMLLSTTTFRMEDDFFYISGMHNGKTEEKRETAREMKKRGADLMFISEVTKLPIDEIKTLLNI